MTEVQHVRKSEGAISGLFVGFLVMLIASFGHAQAQSVMMKQEGGQLRRCVIDELARKALQAPFQSRPSSAESAYDQLGLYLEDSAFQSAGRPSREPDINVLYWDLQQNRSCMRARDANENVETFLDFNLQKILSGYGAASGAPSPDILVLDNCQGSCQELPSLFSISVNELRNVYRIGGSSYNCEFIKKNIQNSGVGTCLFWSKKLRAVNPVDAKGEVRSDRVVDWVPLGTGAESKLSYREKYRKLWMPNLIVKLSPLADVYHQNHLVASNMLANFSPRVFENDFGKRIHIIPTHVNRHLGSAWSNTRKSAWSFEDLGPLRSPSENEAESIVHNQVERYANEFSMYFQDIAAARKTKLSQKDDIFLMVGNFEIPSRTCRINGKVSVKATRALETMRNLAEDVVLTRATESNLCSWPTSAGSTEKTPRLRLDNDPDMVVPKESLPKDRDTFRQSDYVGLQTHHAYVRSFGERSKLNITTSILPLAGSEFYPLSIRIFGNP